jgi:hypothetical protein
VTASRILGAMLIPPALSWFGVLGWTAVLVAEVVIILVAAWNFDRGRRPGAPDPFGDPHHPDFPVPMFEDIRPWPMEDIESPADRTERLGPK